MTDETTDECAHDWRCYFSGHGQPLVKHRCAKCGMFKVIDQAFLGGPHVAVIYQGMDEPYDDKQRRERGESMGWFRKEPDKIDDGGQAFPADGRDAPKDTDYWRHIMKHGDQDHVSSGPIVEQAPDGRLIERDFKTGKVIKERRRAK